MITYLCEYFGLSEEQTRLTVIYVIGAMAQTFAVWYMDKDKIHIPLFVLYILITIIWSIVYNKLFAN